MFEVLSLMVFAGVCYLCLIAIPAFVEKVTSGEFKKAYMKNLAKKEIHSYGKAYF